MPPESTRGTDTEAWLVRARRDLEAGELELGHPSVLWDVTFHAQQGAEKSLKAFLIWHDVQFRKTHDIA